MEKEKQDRFNKLDKNPISTCSQQLAEKMIKGKNPYLNLDYNSLYNFNPEKETFSNTKNAKIKN